MRRLAPCFRPRRDRATAVHQTCPFAALTGAAGGGNDGTEETTDGKRALTAFEWNYDRSEMRADRAIHVAGVIFAIVGAAAMIASAFGLARPVDAVGVSVYAISLIGTLAMSAAYNMWPVGRQKWILRKFDHAGIFLLIAGTYTPFALQMGPRGHWLLACIWTAAILGMVLKIALPGRFDRLAVLLYLGLGWSGLATFDLMTESLSPLVVGLILAGGVFYSSGVIFHLMKRLRFQNAIWHGFVLAGAVIHYCAVFASLMAA